ncbi:hypothetical protein CHS0354_039154 [Potamilus streckersoni]|uniref:P53 and DNA damage-regulated protein 1 n=1 Tax=Potamilus streckersoni TaxID=2493646 RepID=A0AAE0S7F1_9BIVA|nr:hypothetical protein CHS0354_039154 [Potamilus streckersoni]
MDAQFTQKLVNELTSLEEVAEEILADKQEMIDLDKRRQKTREAVRALQKDKKIQKTWVCFGNTFLKLSTQQTKKLLEKDMRQIDDEIDEIRHNLKPKVNKLRDLEHQDDIKGFNLRPLSKEELQSLESFM